MCNVCCREFKGWCKSFTRIETCLSVILALLLAVLLGFLLFLILHLVVCAKQSDKLDRERVMTAAPKPPPVTKATLSSKTSPLPVTLLSSPNTLSPEVECTWIPSKKTKARTHYYRLTSEHKVTQKLTNYEDTPVFVKQEFYTFKENLDERDASQEYKNYVASLVKLKPPEQVTFGCILTKVTPLWTLTAASCIETIEEVDSLDSFFMVDSYGEEQMGQAHAVVDVQIHPLYQGANRSYDLAALRSEDSLVPGSQLLVQLPTMLEYFLVAVGDRLTILGYGGYRTIDRGAGGRRLRQVSTYAVSQAQCAGEAAGGEAWAPRHLRGGAPVAARGGAPCALCAGALRARAAPCAFCAGTPLLRGPELLGLMADNRQCGAACEPALYVNVAALRDWIDATVLI